jgi:hypothetical protein
MTAPTIGRIGADWPSASSSPSFYNVLIYKHNVGQAFPFIMADRNQIIKSQRDPPYKKTQEILNDE